MRSDPRQSGKPVDVPESDGAAAEADVVRGGGPSDGATLGATFSSPTAPSVAIWPFPFGDIWIVIDPSNVFK